MILQNTVNFSKILLSDTSELTQEAGYGVCFMSLNTHLSFIFGVVVLESLRQQIASGLNAHSQTD